MVISFMEKSSVSAFEKKLDRHAFNDDELLSIKTSLNLPYYAGSSIFERAYGTISLHGVVYEYVQRRVQNDTLELLCLPNPVRTKLQAMGNELAKSTADVQTSLPLKKSATLKISLPDFCQALTVYTHVLSTVKHNYWLRNETFSLPLYVHRQERPPQANPLS